MANLPVPLARSPSQALVPHALCAARPAAAPRIEARDLTWVGDVHAPLRFKPFRTRPRPRLAQPPNPLVVGLRLTLAAVSGFLLAAAIASSLGPRPAPALETLPIPAPLHDRETVPPSPSL